MREQKDRFKKERERSRWRTQMAGIGSKGRKMTKLVVRNIKDYEDEGKGNDEEG